jgi:hypothetical protein
MQECKIGIGNANLLCETLRSCSPEDVTGNEIIEVDLFPTMPLALIHDSPF